VNHASLCLTSAIIILVSGPQGFSGQSDLASVESYCLGFSAVSALFFSGAHFDFRSRIE